MSDYHESLWQALPEGLDPPDLSVRLAFLLERAPAGRADDHAYRHVYNVATQDEFFEAA